MDSQAGPGLAGLALYPAQCPDSSLGVAHRGAQGTGSPVSDGCLCPTALGGELGEMGLKYGGGAGIAHPCAPRGSGHVSGVGSRPPLPSGCPWLGCTRTLCLDRPAQCHVSLRWLSSPWPCVPATALSPAWRDYSQDAVVKERVHGQRRAGCAARARPDSGVPPQARQAWGDAVPVATVESSAPSPLRSLIDVPQRGRLPGQQGEV